MVLLQNPLSEKQAGMRTSLIPGLLNNVSRNVRHGVQNILGFELGPVYLPVAGRDLPDEPLHAAIVLAGYREKHWSAAESPLDLYDLKGYLEAILDYFGAEYSIEEIENGTFEPGQSGRVVFGGETLGFFGQVRASVLRDFDVEQPVFLLELNLEPMLAGKTPVPQFVPVPTFPPSRRDLALLVDISVPAGSLREAAMSAGGNTLKSVEIFDVYTGKQVPEGKKSIALSLVFQSEERTLTDADTQKAFDRILKKLQAEFSAEQR
jgi:phenylalanyl-tRNA synthetase beta chain